MLVHTRLSSQGAASGSLMLSLLRAASSRSYFSTKRVIRRSNTNLAYSASSASGKLKFMPSIPSGENGAEEARGASEQTQKEAGASTGAASPFKFQFVSSTAAKAAPAAKPAKWSSHALPSKAFLDKQQEAAKAEAKQEEEKLAAAKQIIDEAKAAAASSAPTTTTKTKTKKRKRALRPRKAIISLSPKAIVHLRALLDQPNPQMIRVGTRNRGCSGTTYDLQYISEPGKFDEVVEQDGVKVVIDSKALFSVVGSEMDWVDEKLQSKFVFKNPNSKGTCGCGESFMV